MYQNQSSWSGRIVVHVNATDKVYVKFITGSVEVKKERKINQNHQKSPHDKNIKETIMGPFILQFFILSYFLRMMY